jgi:dGTPase
VPFSAAANPSIVPRLHDTTTSIRTLDHDTCRPPKCYFDSESDVVDWILGVLTAHDREVFQSFEKQEGKHNKLTHKSFDCSIMDVSDDIAYSVHDHKYASEFGNDVYDRFVSQLFGSSKDRKHFISRLVHHFVTNVEIETAEELEEPLIRYRALEGPLSFFRIVLVGGAGQSGLLVCAFPPHQLGYLRAAARRNLAVLARSLSLALVAAAMPKR